MASKEEKKTHFRDRQEFVRFLETKAINHDCFKHYSSKEGIQSICETHSIILHDGKSWNDVEDGNRLREDLNYHQFAFCFSFSRSESVPMWMLYSNDDGCMIDFDLDSIKSIMAIKEVQIGKYDKPSHSFNSYQSLPVDGSSVKFKLVDIAYYGEPKPPIDSDRFCYYRHSGDTEKQFDRDIIESSRLFCKRIAWSYENECRLIVSVNRNLINWDDQELDLQIVFGQSTIDSLKRKGRIINSPNVSSDDNPDTFYRDNHSSKLYGRINWSLKGILCRNCPNSEVKKV